MLDDELHCPTCLHDWADGSHLNGTCECGYCASLKTTWDDEYDRRYAEHYAGPTEAVLPEWAAPLGPTLESQLLDLDDLGDLPPAKWLIKDVLEFDSETWLIGPAGGFKSFVAIDWACHVAAGRAWRGRPVVEGEVLYVVAEGTKSFAKRIKAWIAEHDVKPSGLIVLPLAVQARGEGFGGTPGVSAQWQELVTLAAKLDPVLIILDTQARMTLGLEENSAKEMGVWVQAVDRLKAATGACVVTVHHTGRDGKDARGSSAIDAAQDMEWKVVRAGGAKALSADLVLEKSKDGDDRTKFSFDLKEIDLPPLADGTVQTSLVLGDDAARKGKGDLGSAVAATQQEASLLGSQEWVRRTLVVQDQDGNGLTTAQLRSTVTKLRREQDLPEIPEATFNSIISKMVTAEKIFRLGRGRVTVHDPGLPMPEDAAAADADT
jgi:AAA domain-containing protein